MRQGSAAGCFSFLFLPLLFPFALLVFVLALRFTLLPFVDGVDVHGRWTIQGFAGHDDAAYLFSNRGHVERREVCMRMWHLFSRDWTGGRCRIVQMFPCQLSHQLRCSTSSSTTFIKKFFSSKSTFKNQFHQNATFIKMPLSSTTFIKPISSEHFLSEGPTTRAKTT